MTRRFWIAFFLCCLASQMFGMSSADDSEAEMLALYERAVSAIASGDSAEAHDLLSELLDRKPPPVLSDRAKSLRIALSRRFPDLARRRQIDQSGRIDSAVFATLFGTALGVGTARIADQTSAKAFAGGMMIGAPTGLATSLLLTRNAEITRGQAALISSAGYWGAWMGYALSILIDRNDDERTIIGGAMAGSLTGVGIGSVVTRTRDIDPGDMAIINYGALWGSWLSLCLGAIADVDDSDRMLALVLTGGNLGAATGIGMASRLNTTVWRASLVNLGGIAGTIAALGVSILADLNDGDHVMGVLASGGLLGMGIAGSLIHFSRSGQTETGVANMPCIDIGDDSVEFHVVGVSF